MSSTNATLSETDPGLPSTSFIIWCSAFVFLMTPGLGLFYSGLARSKNALTNIMICMLAYCIVTIQVNSFYIFYRKKFIKKIDSGYYLAFH
jgi:ammonia channel protein AmtB